MWPSDPETEDSYPLASSSKTETAGGDDHRNPLADFAFHKLPTELLVEIFKHAHPGSAEDAYVEEPSYPVSLSQVCRHWRTVALGAPTLWSNFYVMENYTEQMKKVIRIYLERSGTCPLFLTWFSKPGQSETNARQVIDDLIIPCVERWQRITLLAGNEGVPDALLTVMGSLDFPILRDVEITCLPAQLHPSEFTLCPNAPLLRRCRFRNIPSFPPLPSNLAVLDCIGVEPFNLDTLLGFLPHAAHSLEHLRFGPSATEALVTSRRSRILLQNLKSLLVKDSHTIMDCILVPNLTCFAAFHPSNADAQKVAEMFNGFSAPKLQSIGFHQTPLLPLLTSHNIPSMFPQLESVMFIDCTDESAFAPLLEPPQPKKPSSLQKASKYPPKRKKVENPLPQLKEIAISDMVNWTDFQAAVEKRFKNGNRSLHKIRLPKGHIPDVIMRHLTQWLPKQGVELVLYQSGELSMLTPPEFQDDFCNKEHHLFSDIVEASEWDDEEYDDYGFDYDEAYEDFDYWEERLMDRPDYELPNDYFGGTYDDFDDEEEEEEEDEDEDEFYGA